MTDIAERLRNAPPAQGSLRVLHFEAADEITRLRAALKPFADHAETWTRAGFPEHYPLVEYWPGGPPMADDEPECMDVSFLNVGHLIAARDAMKGNERD